MRVTNSNGAMAATKALMISVLFFGSRPASGASWRARAEKASSVGAKTVNCSSTSSRVISSSAVLMAAARMVKSSGRSTTSWYIDMGGSNTVASGTPSLDMSAERAVRKRRERRMKTRLLFMVMGTRKGGLYSCTVWWWRS